ncbi:MAG: UDP-N-acetylmuramate--L-alanine ligase [Verrucomicrobiota bacterium]|nr:UDP-N-acetylmuramate--L-alanine ligase [Verrucomicrobiota bacterium]
MKRNKRRDISLRECLDRGVGRAHLVGVCGVGMAGLANLLKACGFAVNGCDLQPGRLADWLGSRGIEVRAGHDPSHVDGGVDWVVRSAAAPDDSPEIVRARERGLPVFARGEVLPELLAGKLSVAVAGTHGKTSTSSFLAQALRHAGRQPSWCIGGKVAGDEDSDFAAMGPSEWAGGDLSADMRGAFVVEVDESDGTLALYAPDIAVLTNIELEHMEHFRGEADLVGCFEAFARAAKRRLVFCADDPRVARLAAGFENAAGYGFGESAMARALDWREEEKGQSYRLEVAGRDLGRLALPFRGRQYALNSLAVALAALELGLTPEEIRGAFSRLRLPARRFETIADRDGIWIVSDYAHHPTEIATVVRMIPEGRRLLAVFQPHRYTRTLALGREFPPAFAGVDELVLTPVYAASEPPLKGGSAWDLYRRFRERAGSDSGSARRVSVAESLEQAWGYIRRELRAGDVLLILGAGDIETVEWWAWEDFRVQGSDLGLGVSGFGGRTEPVGEALPPAARQDEPLAGKTTLRVGGRADFWAEVETAESLAGLARWAAGNGLPFRVLGGGSNVLVSDLGARGLTARLGCGFRRVGEEAAADNVTTVVAGAGLSLAAFLDWLEARGWEGLEFLEGIPGTLGGALRMNAGAYGGEIGRSVLWIRCLNPDGTHCMIAVADLGFGYRACRALEGKVALEACFRFERGDAGAIRKLRLAIAARREWMNGLRSAGSAFKNPPGDYAGRLIEQAGLKGFAVGGASVSPRHANVIVTTDGATASDVGALMAIVRAEVSERFGIELEPEIVVMG